MIDKLQNNDILIVPSNIKKMILEEITKEHKLLNIKFYTDKEFIKNYYGDYQKDAIYFLMKHYNYPYDVAIEYLENIYLNYEPLKEMHNILKDNGYLKFNNLFRKNIKRIIVIGYELEPFLKEELEKYETIYLDIHESNKEFKIYEFNKQKDEVTFVAENISKLIREKIDLNKIFLVNVNEDYLLDIKKIFNLFKIPINIYSNKKIYATNIVKKFLNTLKKTKDFSKSLEDISDGDIKNKIISIINDYSFKEVDEYVLKIMTYELKNASIPIPTYKKAINIININEMIGDDNYYFVLGFNQGVVPKLYFDDKIIKDIYRSKLKLRTSYENLLLSKKVLIKQLKSLKNIVVTYKLQDNYSTYYPSPLISEYNLEVIKNPNLEYKYSNNYNKLHLANLLDRYIMFNENDSKLSLFYNTYQDISYKTYSNKYTNIDINDLKEYLKNKVNLSYSSMNNYFLCAFRFYIANILKLDPYLDSFAAFIGSLFHYCLSNMYNTDFDLKKCYEEYLTKRDLTNKEKFYCQKLYSTLEFVINTIRFQESYSSYDKVLTEKHISIDKSKDININFLGFVDKIKYLEKDNQLYISIIDYKTGNVVTTLDNINYGLHLQLPVYIYLIKKGFNKNATITGFYLQRILNSLEVDSKDQEASLRQKLMLDGYTIADENLISEYDHSYEKSTFIKGMSLTSKGFSTYAKLISSKEIDMIVDLVDDKINEVVKAILEGKFSINPKRINNNLVGCEFCAFKEVCYRCEEDIVDLKDTKKDEILGGEANA